MTDFEPTPDYELVMPFVTVISKGGPHDDASYCAGWEMGKLDLNLATLKVHGEISYTLHFTLLTENAAQIDLIAAKHGYVSEIGPCGVEGWSEVNLSRTGVQS
jgi:hypothetical protein